MQDYSAIKYFIKRLKERESYHLKMPTSNNNVFWMAQGYTECCNDILNYISNLEKESK